MHKYTKQESLANAKVNARQHCVSLSCILDDHFLVWRPTHRPIQGMDLE